MKQYMSKPVLALAAAVTIAGGLTPFWADAHSQSGNSTKVVMSEEETKGTRYSLKELETNDRARLNRLMENMTDHLYVVVLDENDKVILDAKLSTFMQQREAEWEKIYRDHYEDIYLELRFDGFISVTSETRENISYIRGEVTDDVTKVVVVKPNGDTIEIVPTAEHTFTATFTAIVSSTPEYAVLKAYVEDKLVETRQVQVNVAKPVEHDVIVSARATYDADKDRLYVRGLVNSGADKVHVTFAGETKEADVKKLWKDAGSFAVTFANVMSDSKQEVLVEAYKNGVKLDSESVTVANLGEDHDGDQPQAYSIKATATISAKHKQVAVKGTVTGVGNADKAKLYVIAPDGKKHEVKLSAKGEFDANISYKNRSFSSKGVRVELYVEGKRVAQALIPHGTPVNKVKPERDQGKDNDHEDKGKGKGKAHVHDQREKQQDEEGKWKRDGDDHDHDE